MQKKKRKNSLQQKNTIPTARKNTKEKNTKNHRKNKQTQYTLQHRNKKPIARKHKTPGPKKKKSFKKKIH